MMKALIIALCLIPGLASAAVAGGGAAAAGMFAAGAAAQNDAARRAEAAKHPADCAACHRELFPFDLPGKCAISSDPFECWRERYVDGRTRIMTRDAGAIRRVYRRKSDYGPDRIFMPAPDHAFNPHYVLEAR